MRVRLTPRSRRLAIGGLVFMLVPIGVAHLAENTVATSYVSESEATVSITPGLTVKDAHVILSQENGKGYYHFNAMHATLTDGQHGVDGETIVFTVGQYEICRAQTMGGQATCNTKSDVQNFPTPLPLTFTATFAGDPPLEAAQVEGVLTVEAPNTGVGTNNGLGANSNDSRDSNDGNDSSGSNGGGTEPTGNNGNS